MSPASGPPGATCGLAAVRRLSGPPRAITGELVRSRLIERLTRRWQNPVTTVVAGPGFGKTTVLAQAVRLDRTRPSGIEAWVTCEPGDEDADQLAAGIQAALSRSDHAAAGSGPTELAPVEIALDALRAASPNRSCLILDDLHELPPDSSGHRLIRDLVRRLPAGSHLVLASRVPPAVPMARLLAAGQVTSLGEADLAFTAAELEQLAERAARPVASVAGLAGWPALVRLALAAGAGSGHAAPGNGSVGRIGSAVEPAAGRSPAGHAQPTTAPAAGDDLWKEVACALPDPDQELLLGLAVLGSADCAILGALVGVPVDLDRLGRIPLVDRYADDAARAHPLWAQALARLLPRQRVQAMRTRAARLLLERSQPVRAGAIALAAGDLAGLERAATALVQVTAATFPHDTGSRWLAAVPAAERDRPGLLLLEAAVRESHPITDRGVDALVDRAAERARVTGDRVTEIAALCLATRAAYARGDEQRLFDLFHQVVEVPETERAPILRLLLTTVHAAMLELAGMVDEAVRLLAQVPEADLTLEPSHSTTRLHVHLLILAGRADEAAVLADRHLASSPYAHVRRMPALAHWLAGHPERLLRWNTAGRLDAVPARPGPDATTRYRLNFLAYAVVIAVSQGDREVLRTLGAQLDSHGPGVNSRDAAMLTVAAAARRVADGDEPGAATTIENLLEVYPISDLTVSVHLRRFLAYGYVLSPQARQAWDDEPLGPVQQRARSVARALLDARAGRLTGPLPDPRTVVTTLPLPWTIELAAHAEGARVPGGVQLIQWLTDHLPTGPRDELRRLAASPTRGALATGARRLLAFVPAMPTTRTRIELLGPLRVLIDGQPSTASHLRRRRVRELLSVLVLFGEIDRTRLTDLLWPDLDPDSAEANLRVTLSYLRRVLEPDRQAGDSGYHLRADADRVCLARSAALEVDLLELREQLDPAGNRADRDQRLAAALRLWRGDPFSDLAEVPALKPQVAQVVGELTELALTVGERRLAEGDTAGAARCAERALAHAPYAERCLRLLLAVELERQDPAAVDRAAQRVHEALAGLGVTAQPATAILLGQAARWASPQSAALLH